MHHSSTAYIVSNSPVASGIEGLLTLAALLMFWQCMDLTVTKHGPSADISFYGKIPYKVCAHITSFYLAVDSDLSESVVKRRTIVQLSENYVSIKVKSG